MNLIPALASPGAGHAGRAHLWAAPAATTSRERRGLGEILGEGGGFGGWSTPSPVGARWTRERIARVASLGALLALTAMLYLVGLSASGYANEFYAAAAQAGSVDWWAFLWGSSDAGNSITVDKPPASLWAMALSIRLFGLSSWSLLVPQALMGVASVGVLYATVRRGFGHWCGLLAGALLATTPVACLMFRFDNPDALLVLLLVGSASCVLKAASLGVGEGREADEADGVSSGAGDVAGLGWCEDRAANRRRTLWMALAGALMGLAFLTKQLQAFLVLPGFAVAFLVASPTRMRRRLLDSAVALGAMVVAAGWWVLLTVLVPADMRPYFGGSETNSFVELTFWYNGLGRIFGNTVGNGSMARQGILMGTGGEASLARLLTGIWATQWSWALPAALVGTGVGLSASGRARRTDARRAQVMLWAGWLLVTFVTFSYMEGTIHQYYTVALAPAVAALAAIGARALWELREHRWARAVAACAVVASAAWATALVMGTSWLVAVLLGGVWICAAGAVGLLVAGEVLRARGRALPSAAARVCAVLAVASLLVVPVAHSVYTASQGHHGSIVTAGPSVAGSDAMGGMGGNGGPGGNGGGRDGGMGGNAAAGGPASTGGNGGPGAGMGSSADGSTSGGGPMAGAVPSAGGSFPGGSAPSGGMGGSGAGDGTAAGQNAPTDGAGDGQGMPADGSSGSQSAPDGGQSASDGGQSAPTVSDDGGRTGGAGTMGSMLGGTSVSSEVTNLLLEDADSYTWVAAAIGSQSAAGYQLATELPVMPIGGFNGTDPSPTLDEFKEYVAEGRIHYFIAGGQGAGRGGASSDEESIESWVAENFESVTVDGVTLYDLTSPVA